MKRLTLTILIPILTIGILSTLTAQTTITLPAIKDATIFSEKADGSNGSGSLFAGRTNQGALRRALVQFDVSEIPQSAMILSASLFMTGSRQSTDNVTIHRVTSEWGEGSTAGSGAGGGIPSQANIGDATWTHGRYGEVSWTAEGGDYIAVGSADGNVSDNTVASWRGEEMIWDVRSWLIGNAPNHGWIMIGDEDNNGTAVRLISREGGANTPYLVVTYRLPGDCEEEAGLLTGGPFTFCVGDGIEDKISTTGIGLFNNTGTYSQWVVTDEDRNILGLPGSFSDVDFEGAGAGTCLIFHLQYAEGLSGLGTGLNVNNMQGCFSLSNPVIVRRTVDGDACVGPGCTAHGGTLSGGPFYFCVGDGNPDNVHDGGIVVSANTGAYSQWVVTDIYRNILGLPASYTDVDFDGAGIGTCHIWNVQYDGTLTGLAVGQNLGRLSGCFDISNPVAVMRTNSSTVCGVGAGCDANGGLLTGGPIYFCVGDGVADRITAAEVGLFEAQGGNSSWVITDIRRNILALPSSYTDLDFDNSGVGTCLLYHLQYDTGISGLSTNQNLDDMTGCYSLSNPVTIVRSNNPDYCEGTPACQVAGGLLTGGPFNFCVGDGVPDRIPSNSIGLFEQSGPNAQWIVTDINRNILGLPGSFSDVDFDGAGVGVCQIWHLQYEGDIEGLAMNANLDNLEGCFSISNPVAVSRSNDDNVCGSSVPVCDARGGQLLGGPFEFCVGDGVPDYISPEDLHLSGATGAYNRWIFTSNDKIILAIEGSVDDINFDSYPVGSGLLWHISTSGSDQSTEAEGLEIGNSLGDITGCFGISSSPIEVSFVECDTNACKTPTNLKAVKINSYTYRISWSRGDNNVTKFQIMMGFEGEPGSFVVIPWRNNTITIQASWSKTVVFKVRAMCSWTDASDYSEELVLGTKQGKANIGVPNDLTFDDGTKYGAFTIVTDMLSLAPNPASNFINVSIETHRTNSTVEIYDMNGRMVYTAPTTGKNVQPIDITQLSPGMYMLSINSAGTIIESKRFVVAR